MKRLWVVPFLFLLGCGGEKTEGAKNMTIEATPMNVELGVPVDGLLGNSPLEFAVDCLDAVNTCWYEIDLTGKEELIDLSVIQPDSTLELKRVVGVDIVVNGDVTKNVENIVVTLRGLPDNSSHEENKKLVYKLISDLRSAGWKKYYFPSDPRIASSELDKFDWRDTVFGVTPLSHPLFDPNNEMSMQQWLAGDSFYDWYLYSGQYIAHVKVQKRNSAADPSSFGTYLVRVEFKSLDNFWRTDFEEKDRAQWKALFPDHLTQLLKKRSEVEAKAKAAGVALDESYQAPQMEQVRKQ